MVPFHIRNFHSRQALVLVIAYSNWNNLAFLCLKELSRHKDLADFC